MPYIIVDMVVYSYTQSPLSDRQRDELLEGYVKVEPNYSNGSVDQYNLDARFMYVAVNANSKLPGKIAVPGQLSYGKKINHHDYVVQRVPQDGLAINFDAEERDFAAFTGSNAIEVNDTVSKVVNMHNRAMAVVESAPVIYWSASLFKGYANPQALTVEFPVYMREHSCGREGQNRCRTKTANYAMFDAPPQTARSHNFYGALPEGWLTYQGFVNYYASYHNISDYQALSARIRYFGGSDSWYSRGALEAAQYIGTYAVNRNRVIFADKEVQIWIKQ